MSGMFERMSINYWGKHLVITFFFRLIVSSVGHGLSRFWGSLLESNSGSYSAAPPLMLLDKFSGKPVKFLEVTLLPNSLSSKQHWLYILLLQHLLCYSNQHLYVAGTWICIHIGSTTPHARPICLSHNNPSEHPSCKTQIYPAKYHIHSSLHHARCQ